MFITIGNIRLEAIEVTQHSENTTATFAEHAVIKGKPVLQATGEGLNGFTLALRLHWKTGSVEQRWNELNEAKQNQNPMICLFGIKNKGNFVIDSLNSRTIITDDNATVLCREIDVTLKEYAGDVGNTLVGSALQFTAIPLISAILPSDAQPYLATVKDTASFGVRSYQKIDKTISDVLITGQQIAKVIEQPAQTLALLPSIFNQLDGAVDLIAALTNKKEDFAFLNRVLTNASDYWDYYILINSSLENAKITFDPSQLEFTSDDLSKGLSQVNEAQVSMDNLASLNSEISAFVISREDEGAE